MHVIYKCAAGYVREYGSPRVGYPWFKGWLTYKMAYTKSHVEA